MHRVSKLRIQNFKSIIDAEFLISTYTPLVGYNNAGKTNILQALSWAIKKTSLQKADYGDPASPVVVTAEISGIDGGVLEALEESHRNRIEPYIVEGCVAIRRTQAAPGIGIAHITLEVRQIESGDENWVPNPTGIDQAISRMFPDPIFVGAMENATEDVGKYASGTTIGKLIKEIIGPVAERNSGDVVAALGEVAKRLSADGSEKDHALVELDDRIGLELGKFFPGVVAKTHIPTPEFADFLKSTTIKIYDQQFDHAIGRDVSSFGHGAQRSVQIALIKCLSEIKRQAVANQSRTTLLLIDEPELYLHPQAIEIVRASLSRLSAEGYQVAFSTHSANMIAREDAPNALLVRRTSERGTTSFPRIVDAVRAAITEANHQSETLFALSNSTKVLFSEKIILAEGKTEQKLLPNIFSHEVGKSLEEEKFGLISLGSSNDVPNALKVLKEMGIPTKAVVDLDFAFRPAVKEGLICINHPGIVKCREILVRLQSEGRICLGHDGLPQGNGHVTSAKAFELLAAEQDAAVYIEAIHNDLSQQGIWVWTKGTIETHLALKSKSPSAHLAFLDGFKAQDYRDGLPGYPSVRALVEWLRGE